MGNNTYAVYDSCELSGLAYDMDKSGIIISMYNSNNMLYNNFNIVQNDKWALDTPVEKAFVIMSYGMDRVFIIDMINKRCHIVCIGAINVNTSVDEVYTQTCKDIESIFQKASFSRIITDDNNVTTCTDILSVDYTNSSIDSSIHIVSDAGRPGTIFALHYELDKEEIKPGSNNEKCQLLIWKAVHCGEFTSTFGKRTIRYIREKPFTGSVMPTYCLR